MAYQFVCGPLFCMKVLLAGASYELVLGIIRTHMCVVCDRVLEFGLVYESQRYRG